MSRVSNRPLVIFGTGELAELAHFYFSQDTNRTIAGFTLDQDWVKEDTFKRLPVVSYENLEHHFPPTDFDLFIALGYSKLNATRAKKFKDAKSRGYSLATYLSSKCIFYDDLKIGENCFVMEGTQIQPFVDIRDNVIIWSGSLVSHHVKIEDHCFIAAHAVISGMVRVEPYCFIGVNATIREKLVLARNTIVGAGAVILQSTEENQSYPGNPCKKSGIPSHRFQSLL